MKTAINATLNKRERRAAQLLAHYATCERLAVILGHPKPDGKKISVALWKLERRAHSHAIRICNDSAYTQVAIDAEQDAVYCELSGIFAAKVPPGYFLNQDPRGYALKIDNETPEGAALIAAAGMHRDMGGYGILSHEIDGN